MAIYESMEGPLKMVVVNKMDLNLPCEIIVRLASPFSLGYE